ncbi:hypothetical protein AMK32_03095 [Streptomyces sp. CB01883]|nr:hypothetical protein AMK32_03095 [Streptomyces sp. CB01883]
MVEDRGRVESGLLGRLAPRRLQRCLAGFDAVAGRLPEPRSVERVAPAQEQQADGGVQADDPCVGPV